MSRSLSCSFQRSAMVLVWLPLFLLFPALDLADDPWLAAGQVALLLLVAATVVAAVLTGPSSGGEPVDLRAYAAWGLLVVAVAVSSGWGGGWQPLWGLAAITAPTVLRGGRLVAAVLLLAAATTVTGWLTGPRETFWIGPAGLVLSAVSTTALLRLVETIAELRRTREELALAAVARERERFSRDLHDLLGHSLSVMVVKAEAVRRLVERDPTQALHHASDLERVGREALLEVRQAVDGTRGATLAEAIVEARHALDSARIAAEVALDVPLATTYDGVPDGTPLPARSDEALAWVLREATTNVLRHSGADSCRIEVSHQGDRAVLVVADDGVGGPDPALADGFGRRGGLDGLRSRLRPVGGDLAVTPGPEGFRLVASVPAGVG